jgi:hypothetical protein
MYKLYHSKSNIAQDLKSGASRYSFGNTPLLNTKCFLEHERTPGEVAVSGIYGWNWMGDLTRIVQDIIHPASPKTNLSPRWRGVGQPAMLPSQ